MASDRAEHERFVEQVVRMAEESARSGLGGPFAALVVRDGEVIGRGVNRVTSALDPTAHAEVQALRDACARIGDFRLDGAVLYASCMPCPMCYAAIYWARIAQVYYAADAQQAEAVGFDDVAISADLGRMPERRAVPCRHLHSARADEPFRVWLQYPNRVEY